jgi:GMP synthase (glutamine-hydrolysing)
LLEPLGHVYGVSDKVLAMAMAQLLLGGDAKRAAWVEAGRLGSRSISWCTISFTARGSSVTLVLSIRTGRAVTAERESAGLMLNILLAEGTPAVWQAERGKCGLPSNFSLFAAAVQLHHPGVRCTPLNIADGEALPVGIALSDFDGVMFPGSPLHIYDPDPCVTRQIDFARSAFAAGLPVWGSCWGLQLAAAALGGSVRRNPRGRELPIARAITVTEAGRAHPLLASRPAVFDALCSHLDEIETLPPNSQVLAANEVSAVQAIAVEIPLGASFHGTQYHPEHTLAVSAALIEMRAAELVQEGFGTAPSEIVAIAADYRALANEPTRRDLIWRDGVASEIIDPVRRTTEIGNWLRTVVVPRRF